MKNVFGIGCPSGQAGRGELVPLRALLFCLLLFVFGTLSAQCNGVMHPWDAYEMAYECATDGSMPGVQVVHCRIGHAANVASVVLDFQFEAPISKIDNLWLEWLDPQGAAFPGPSIHWTQDPGWKQLRVQLDWEPCMVVGWEVCAFRLMAHTQDATPVPWESFALDGGIVQVDVIQAKQLQFETRQVLTFDGTLVRESRMPIQAAHDLSGLQPGLYWIRRIASDGRVTQIEKYRIF